MRAYIDESIHAPDPGLYVLAAVVVRHDQAEQVRVTLREGLRHKRGRFHWRDEEQADRESMAKTVNTLDLFSVVAIAPPTKRSKTERARNICMTQLLWELEQRAVADVLLESRQEKLNKADRSVIAAAQRATYISRNLQYAFAPPSEKCLLWLPDLVAGAVSYSHTGTSTTCMETLGASVTVVDVGPGT